MKSEIAASNLSIEENFAALSELKALCKSIGGRTADFPVISGGGYKRRISSMSVGRARRRTVSFENRRANFRTSLDSFNIRNENQLLDKWLKKLDGQSYNLDITGVGIFPLMMQVVHNNFTDGMHKIGFRLCENNAYYIDIYEGVEVYSLRCGFGGKRYVSEINMHGEKYLVSLDSICKTDEYNRFVIRNDIYFLEEACLRTLNICFEDDAVDRVDRKGTFIHPSVPSGIELRLFETPGSDMLINTMKSITPDGFGGVQGVLFSRLVKGGVKEVFEEAVKNTIQPVIHGKLATIPFEMMPEQGDDSDA